MDIYSIDTSKIKIRPFVPFAKDEEKEGREPYAVLKYGNVEIELDYTVMRMLSIDSKSSVTYNLRSITHSAFEEIIKEMNYDLYGKLPNTHRDGDHPFLTSISENPLHPINKDHITYL